MKKVFIAAVCLAGAFSLSAQACPRGTHPEGGTGPHHKGGTCVTNNGGAPHAHHDAKAHKKPHAEKQPHHDKTRGPGRNHPSQQPKQPLANGPAAPADQTPDR